MIRCFIFDFDGTLVHSNDIKKQGFLEIAGTYNSGIESMEKILAFPPGDRTEIFSKFVEVLGLNINVNTLVEKYTIWCESKILKCPERIGSSDILSQLSILNIPVYINSATPLSPLLKVVKQRYSEGLFAGVFGGHGKKIENLNSIHVLENIEKDEMLLIGDGVDDYIAAYKFGCQFIGLSDGTLQEEMGELGLYSDLNILLKFIELPDK